MPTIAISPRPVAPVRRALLGALLVSVLLAGAAPAFPVAAQEAQPGSGGGGFAPRPDDFDIDGLLNEEEAIYGTDPTNADTDGDGYPDGQEVSGPCPDDPLDPNKGSRFMC